MARDFNGTTQRVGNTVSGVAGVSTMTVAIWARPTGDGEGVGFPAIVNSETATPTLRWRIKPTYDIDNSWALLASSTGGNFQWVTDASGLTQNVWHHILFTMDWGSVANDAVLYRNGVLEAVTETLTGSGSFANDGNVLSVGGETALNRCYDGWAAELGIWNRILKSSEIAALGKGYSPAFFQNGLIIYVPLIGNSSPEPEFASGKNMTLVNAPTKATHPRIIYPRNFR